MGQSSQLSPTVGGTWSSLHPTVASVSNTGLVTGLSSGVVSFLFTQTSTGCQATFNNAITVLSRPVVNVTGPNPICIGGNTTLTPTVGGTWSSTNPAVAIVNAGGIVTGISSGISTFIFTNTTGCSSLPSAPVTVSGRPNTLLQGSPTICIGNTTQFSPTTGGTWTSSNPLVATINNQGLVSGVALGTATFTFTDLSTGCISNPTSQVTVQAPAVLQITGPNVICLGYTTTLSASSSGIWYSTHPSVASVSSIGVVTGKAPGKVSFSF
ncbi:MAG: Ig-like domain-containing protein [Saprospiraceae bacterium]|nr:Ig-like domain-containing protein [Saprospiraceae bacterium]